MYLELRLKSEGILDAGHNLLGAMLEPLQRFRAALPEDMSEASMTIVWFRGNALRSILRAHDEVKALPRGSAQMGASAAKSTWRVLLAVILVVRSMPISRLEVVSVKPTEVPPTLTSAIEGRPKFRGTVMVTRSTPLLPSMSSRMS